MKRLDERNGSTFWTTSGCIPFSKKNLNLRRLIAADNARAD
jgi:hypothetical protein